MGYSWAGLYVQEIRSSFQTPTTENSVNASQPCLVTMEKLKLQAEGVNQVIWRGDLQRGSRKLQGYLLFRGLK
jgi:hypothetical protein